jgi:hypothetical protein
LHEGIRVRVSEFDINPWAANLSVIDNRYSLSKVADRVMEKAALIITPNAEERPSFVDSSRSKPPIEH